MAGYINPHMTHDQSLILSIFQIEYGIIRAPQKPIYCGFWRNMPIEALVFEFERK